MQVSAPPTVHAPPAARRYSWWRRVRWADQVSAYLFLLIVGFIGLWKDFLLPSLVLPLPELQPVTVRLWYMLNGNPSFLALLPPLAIAIFLQRHLQRGLSLGGVKG